MTMHADEKSDQVIVLKKLPNKEADFSGEAVEGRATPKGNISQTAVVRTPGRADRCAQGGATVDRLKSDLT